MSEYQDSVIPVSTSQHGDTTCLTHADISLSDAITTAMLQVPVCASVAVPAYSFPEKFSSFSFLSLLTKAEVIAALVKVRAECNKVGLQPECHAWSVITAEQVL